MKKFDYSGLDFWAVAAVLFASPAVYGPGIVVGLAVIAFHYWAGSKQAASVQS